jgi:pSer/pThr/pTyr-binding forkhead associated (FHA) protein
VNINSSIKNNDTPVLSVLMGPETGERYVIDKSIVTIGRGEDRDIHFNDRAMSRKHCEIHARENSLIIRDSGSQNGIKVNGLITIEQELHDGDLIDLGSIRLVVNIPSPNK